MQARNLVKSTSLLVVLSFIVSTSVYAQQLPSGVRSMGSLESELMGEKKQKSLVKKVETKRKEPVIEEDQIIPKAPELEGADSSYKVFIKKIEVEGAETLDRRAVNAIILPYENRELTLQDFRDITEKITGEYRKKGNVTSMAYLVPQKIENNTLKIMASEGRVGDITVTGNDYFKTSLLLRYLDTKKGQILNYDELRKNLSFINESPDRNASVVLVKGKEQGETDIDMKVEDKMPLHAMLGYNNYNPRYLDRNRFMAEIKSNNFLGLGHIFSIEGQSELNNFDMYQLVAARYLMPLWRQFKVGAYYMRLRQNLGGDVSTLNVKGEGDIASVYCSYKFIDTENLTININPGFDYKDIDNKVLGVTVSQDRLRVAKLSFDIDWSDMFGGRTIVVQELHWGIPNMFGGLKSEDSRASRASAGTGGSFFKYVLNGVRVQSLPWEMSALFKGAVQLSSDSLCSTEQYNVGGISTVRGYPVAEYAGDNGFLGSAELYVPPYFIPKEWKVPFTDIPLYQSLRIMGFFDWGLVTTRDPQAGETSSEIIYSAGPAIRFNIPEKVSVSFDYGYALGQKATDGSAARAYVEVKIFI
jgi:hemolysin activation/secretion protein